MSTSVQVNFFTEAREDIAELAEYFGRFSGIRNTSRPKRNRIRLLHKSQDNARLATQAGHRSSVGNDDCTHWRPQVSRRPYASHHMVLMNNRDSVSFRAQNALMRHAISKIGSDLPTGFKYEPYSTNIDAAPYL